MPLYRPTPSSIAGVLAAAVWATAAPAQTPTFTLRWDAPTPDCPDEAYVRSAVQQLLGGEDPATAGVEARARVERVSEGVWRERLTTVREGAAGERVVESSSCKSLANATALIVALSVDPQLASQASPDSAGASADVPTAAPALTPPPLSARESAPPLAPAAPFPPSRFAAFAALSGGVGTLPKAAYGFHLGGAVLFQNARLEAYGAFWPSQHATGTSSPGAGGDVYLADGGVRACWVPLPERLAFAACPGLELGDLHGQGTGVRAPTSSDGVWFAATALARITWRFDPSLGFFLDASVVVPFERDRFALDQQTIHRASSVEGVASAGAELRF